MADICRVSSFFSRALCHACVRVRASTRAEGGVYQFLCGGGGDVGPTIFTRKKFLKASRNGGHPMDVIEKNIEKISPKGIPENAKKFPVKKCKKGTLRPPKNGVLILSRAKATKKCHLSLIFQRALRF